MTSTDEISIPPTAPCAVNQVNSPEFRPRAHSLYIAQLKALVRYTDPCSHNDDRDLVLRALHHETNGSGAGLAIADEWSSHADDYPGPDEIARKWHSLKDHTGDPVTVGTLCDMVEANGFDWIDICDSVEPDLEPCEYQVMESNGPLAVTPSAPQIPFMDYSLQGMSEQLAKEISDQVLILGLIILMYQSSVIYASPNTGKTLIIIRLLINAIKQGKIEPSCVFYFNLDDTPNGLIEKLKLAEEYGFHIIAEGYKDFKAAALLEMLADLVQKDQASSIIIILDTLKKITDLMDKRMSSRFGKAIRNFVMKGGTCVSLAHTNKYRNSDGKPIYAGTTDIIDDADCAYLMYEIEIDVDAETKTIQFENIKSRGKVARQVAYRYSISENLSYREILDSVEPVNDSEVSSLVQAAELESDAKVIDTVIACIRDGINSKMLLAETVAERSGISKRAAVKIIEKYTGTDPNVHRWNYKVHEKGAKKYRLLDPIMAGTDPVS